MYKYVKKRLSGYTWNPYHSTLAHQQYIGNKTQVLFLLLKLKGLLLELNTLTLMSAFYKNNLTKISLFQNMRSLVPLQNICAQNYVQVQLSDGVKN